MDISLAEYIRQEGIKYSSSHKASNQYCATKFDRYKAQDDGSDDEMKSDEIETLTKPSLKRYIPKIQPGRKSVHERLGGRQSGCESIHLNRIYSLETNFKAKKSIQNRLSKNFFNPSAAERNRITLQTLNTLTSCAKKTTDTTDEMNGNFLFQALSNAIKTVPKKKYDMRIQKEITCLQGRELFYTCPGANVISFDGPGIEDALEIPQNQTSITMNQRFA